MVEPPTPFSILETLGISSNFPVRPIAITARLNGFVVLASCTVIGADGSYSGRVVVLDDKKTGVTSQREQVR